MKLNGSYTIEASIIVPIIFFIISAMIFLSFYVHDVTILRSVSYKTIIECYGSGNTEEMINEKVEKTFLVIKDYNIDYRESGDSASLRITYKYKLPFKYLNKFLNEISTKKTTDISVKNLRGRDDLLKIKIIRDITDCERENN